MLTVWIAIFLSVLHTFVSAANKTTTHFTQNEQKNFRPNIKTLNWSTRSWPSLRSLKKNTILLLHRSIFATPHRTFFPNNNQRWTKSQHSPQKCSNYTGQKRRPFRRPRENPRAAQLVTHFSLLQTFARHAHHAHRKYRRQLVSPAFSRFFFREPSIIQLFPLVFAANARGCHRYIIIRYTVYPWRACVALSLLPRLSLFINEFFRPGREKCSGGRAPDDAEGNKMRELYTRALFRRARL